MLEPTSLPDEHHEYVRRMYRTPATTTATIQLDDVGLRPAVDCALFVRGHYAHRQGVHWSLSAQTRAWLLLDVEGNDLLVQDPDGTQERWTVHDPLPALAALLVCEQPPVINVDEAYGLGFLGTVVLYPRRPHDVPWRPCEPASA